MSDKCLAALVKTRLTYSNCPSLGRGSTSTPSFNTVLGAGSELSSSETPRGGGRLSSTRRRRKGCATQSSHALEDRRCVSSCLGTGGGSGIDTGGGRGGEMEGIAEGGEKDALRPPFGDG